MPEYKHLPTFTKTISDRTVTGIFAVHGNVDEGGDRSFPGLFGDFTAGGRKRVVYLWQHDYTQPPIAKIDDIYEVTRADLPPEVLTYAPNTSGGVGVKRTYLDTPRGNEVLGALRADALREMSYAYEPTDFKYETVDGADVRDLYKAALLDISDVTWGMNPATVGSKNLPLEVEHQTVLATVDAYIKRYEGLAALRAKEGRVLSGDNRKRIESAVDALSGAMDALNVLLSATEPKRDTAAIAAAAAEAAQLFAQFQRTTHYLNGVTLL